MSGTVTQKSALAARHPAEHMATNSSCAGCGQAFRCGATDGDARCWCFELPALEKVTDGAGCYCPQCLAKLTSEF
jgi:hypothetical protein